MPGAGGRSRDRRRRVYPMRQRNGGVWPALLPSCKKFIIAGICPAHYEGGFYIMKIAVTYENGEVFQHFGHCGAFKIYEVENQQVQSAQVGRCRNRALPRRIGKCGRKCAGVAGWPAAIRPPTPCAAITITKAGIPAQSIGAARISTAAPATTEFFHSMPRPPDFSGGLRLSRTANLRSKGRRLAVFSVM